MKQDKRFCGNRLVSQHALRALTASVLLTTALLASAQGTAMPDTMKPGAMPSSSMDMSKSMAGMMKNMQDMPMSGNTDHDFAAMMKMHHQGAIDMAQAELASGKDPKLRKMAQNIIAAQKKEIQEFDNWMKTHPAETSTQKHK